MQITQVGGSNSKEYHCVVSAEDAGAISAMAASLLYETRHHPRHTYSSHIIMLARHLEMHLDKRQFEIDVWNVARRVSGETIDTEDLPEPPFPSRDRGM